jgi:fructosamine-3-kinase
MATGTVTLPNTAPATTPAAPPADTDTVTIVCKDGRTYQRRRRGAGALHPRSRSKAAPQTFYVLTSHDSQLHEFKTEAETLAFVEDPETGDVTKVIRGVELKVSLKAALTVA